MTVCLPRYWCFNSVACFSAYSSAVLQDQPMAVSILAKMAFIECGTVVQSIRQRYALRSAIAWNSEGLNIALLPFG